MSLMSGAGDLNCSRHPSLEQIMKTVVLSSPPFPVPPCSTFTRFLWALDTFPLPSNSRPWGDFSLCPASWQKPDPRPWALIPLHGLCERGREESTHFSPWSFWPGCNVITHCERPWLSVAAASDTSPRPLVLPLETQKTGTEKEATFWFETNCTGWRRCRKSVLNGGDPKRFTSLLSTGYFGMKLPPLLSCNGNTWLPKTITTVCFQ